MRISDDEFEHAIEEVLADLPERFKRATMSDPRGELLGLYEGVPITRRTTGYSGVMPDVITLFKGPHERLCSTPEQLRRQIRKTVLHEIGHYFGFDDEYLHAHGY